MHTARLTVRSEQRREDEEAAGSTYSLSNGDAVATPLLGDAAVRRRSLVAPAQTLRIAVSLEVASPPRHALILRDLFWTLYSKLSAVLEGHRVVYEVSRWISSVSSDTSEAGLELTSSAAGIQGHYFGEGLIESDHPSDGNLATGSTRGPRTPRQLSCGRSGGICSRSTSPHDGQ